MSGKRKGNRRRRQNRARLTAARTTVRAVEPTPAVPAVGIGAEPGPAVDQRERGESREPRAVIPPERRGPRRRRRLWAVAIVAFWVLVLLGAIFAGVSLWVRRTFGVISVDQLLTNLPGGGGEGAGGDGLVLGAVVTGIVIPVAAVLVLMLLSEKSRRVLRSHGILSGRRVWALRLPAMLLAVVVPLGGAAFLGSTIGAGDYLQAYVREATTGASLADYYVAPGVDRGTGETGGGGEPGGGAGTRAVGGGGGAAVPSGADDRRNLVLIYLESIEDALGDDRLFEKNMLEPVQDATEGWSSIPSLRQYDGGGWTMSGIVGTQCGIPLRTAGSLSDIGALNDIGAEGHEVESYLPGATCLGDVLRGEGYRNVFLGGADADFAGKGVFLSGHGYDEIKDLDVWRDLGETEIRDDWGLSDRRLFERAKEEVARLHDADRPFNLTMLSLDTHEGPRVYDYCDWDTELAMTSITYCSMQQVQGFVEYMDEEGMLEDTTVVVMGDHQKMIAEGGSFWEELKDRDDRTIFNRVWSPDGARFARGDIDQLSMYPTILELAGVELPDHRAGIGVSALVPADEVPGRTILGLSEEEYADLVRSRSVEFFGELWGQRAAPQAGG